jgi:hypothetical protein
MRDASFTAALGAVFQDTPRCPLPDDVTDLDRFRVRRLDDVQVTTCLPATTMRHTWRYWSDHAAPDTHRAKRR